MRLAKILKKNKITKQSTGVDKEREIINDTDEQIGENNDADADHDIGILMQITLVCNYIRFVDDFYYLICNTFYACFLIIILDNPKDVVSDNEKEINIDGDEQYEEEFALDNTSLDKVEGALVNIEGELNVSGDLFLLFLV